MFTMKTATLVVVFVVAASTHAAPEVGRVKRLTTFSKPPDQNTPTIAQRECKQSTECSIRGTSCREDRRDSKLRCLCDDGEPPTKGQCPNRKRVRRGYLPTGNRRPTETKDPPKPETKPLFMPAEPPTVSFFPQSATTVAPKRRLFTPSSFPLALREKCNRDEECIPQAHCILNTTVVKGHKVCLCEPEVEENDGACGGSASLAEAGSLLLVIGLVKYLLQDRL